jgi:hypothetical protein
MSISRSGALLLVALTIGLGSGCSLRQLGNAGDAGPGSDGQAIDLNHGDAPSGTDAPLDRMTGPDSHVPSDADPLDGVLPDRGSLTSDGAACTHDADCINAHCVDGVCCNSVCSGQCQSCSEPDSPGICQTISGAPRGSRTDCQGIAPCRGLCDGNNPLACSFPGNTTQCLAGSCSGGTATTASACNGAGACTTSTTTACTSNQCADSTKCSGGCNTASPCGAGTYCDPTGVCLSLKSNGTQCQSSSECTSTVCTDNVCCGSTCDGQCQSCNEPNKAGACVNVKGTPHGNRNACAGTAPCQGQCDGSNGIACVLSAGDIECEPATCTNGSQTSASVCNGAGACTAKATMTCASNQCADVTKCSGGCSASLPCAGGQYCNSTGACVSQKLTGTTCQSGSECASTYCVDGVCCGSACGGQCQSCNEPTNPGTCLNISGTPRGARTSCPGAAACQSRCDGSNGMACSFPGNSVQCAAASCANGSATTASVCNGAGTCTTPTTTACMSNLCADAIICSGGCGSSAPCGTGQYCGSGGVCLSAKSNGTQCQSDSECSSAHCVDNVCCNDACTGQCQGCAETNHVGSCLTVSGAPRGSRPACNGTQAACAGFCGGTLASQCSYPDGQTVCAPASCTEGSATTASVCNSAGTCTAQSAAACTSNQCADATRCSAGCGASLPCANGRYCNSSAICVAQKPNGAQCQGGSECTSTFCVDGVCCGNACGGQCQACNEPNNVGTCLKVSGAPRGSRSACGGMAPCQSICDGSNGTACTFPGSSSQCTVASCTNGSATGASVCNGTGACTTPSTTACASNQCADGTRCSGGCSASFPCATGQYCSPTGICLAQKLNGAQCQTGPECASAFCVDNVCCNSACSGQCQGCAEPTHAGACLTVTGAPRGSRAACNGTQAICAGTCGGSSATQCAYPTVTCGAQSCSSGVKTAAVTCNGGGQCATPLTTTCASGCNAAGTDCLICGSGLAACNGICCLSGQGCCGGVCVDTTSNVQMCGKSCTVCPTPDRAIATCNQGACGTTCVGGAPKCSDGSCSRLSWNFDSTDLDGITPSSVQVRNFNGNQALAVDVAQLSALQQGEEFTVPICLSGSVDLSAKTVSMRIFFDGVPGNNPGNFPVQVIVVSASQESGFLDFMVEDPETWISYSSPFSLSTLSQETAQIIVQATSFGGPFSGTIWFDDITIQ